MENSVRAKFIVVGVDGSPASAAALRWALEEAVRGGAEVVAITTRERQPAFVPATSTGFFPHGEKPHQHLVRDLHDLVRDLAARRAVWTLCSTPPQVSSRPVPSRSRIE